MGVKISGLTAKGATIADTDLVEVSQSAGGGTYVSRSVTGANIKALVTDANMTTTDITTNDVSTSKHGFAPKAPNDTTKFLRGDGTWAVPASGGLTKFTEAENTSAPNGTVYVDSLTAAASSTNADFVVRPKGNGALLSDIPDNTTTGGNKRGQYAVDFQRIRGAATNVASGARSFVFGQNNTASGANSFAFGNYSTASNQYTICGAGEYNSATGSYGIALGNGSGATAGDAIAIGSSCISSGDSSVSLGRSNTASGYYSYAFGASCVANATTSIALGYESHTLGVRGRLAYSAGKESTAGDSQKSTFVLRNRTTDATATLLTLDSGTTIVGDNMIYLSNQSAYRFKGTIIGKKSGTTDIAAWDIDGLIVRGANAAATTLAVSNVTLVQNTPAWGTPTLAADTTNGGLEVKVTGAATTNIQWTCAIETTEVIYA